MGRFRVTLWVFGVPLGVFGASMGIFGVPEPPLPHSSPLMGPFRVPMGGIWGLQVPLPHYSPLMEPFGVTMGVLGVSTAPPTPSLTPSYGALWGPYGDIWGLIAPPALGSQWGRFGVPHPFPMGRCPNFRVVPPPHKSFFSPISPPQFFYGFSPFQFHPPSQTSMGF